MLAVLAGLSLGQIAVYAIVIAAVVAIVWIAMRAMGVQPPGWAVQVFWVVVIAIVCILAIRLVLSM